MVFGNMLRVETPEELVIETRPEWLAHQILEYVKLHPGCRRMDVEMALDILAHDFMDARKVLGELIVSKKGAGREAYYYAV